MFVKACMVNRRKQLIDKMSGGLVLILGNEEAPANYPSKSRINSVRIVLSFISLV